MIGLNPDLFVGLVAIAVGLFVASSAACNWQWYYQLRKSRWIEAKLGRTGSRIVFVILGGALIVLGVLIAMGLVTSRSASQGTTPQRSVGAVQGDPRMIPALSPLAP